MGEIRNNKSSHELDDGELEIISGGNTLQSTFYNLTTGAIECIVDINNGQVVNLRFPGGEDNRLVIAKEYLNDLVKKGYITDAESSRVEKRLELYSSLT